jgi:peptidoglycan/xylan/chitin deacetylase (PgdA/CDA1 family)
LPTLRSTHYSAVLVLPAFLIFSANAAAQQTQAPSIAPPPAHLTAEQDHQRTMGLLHIKSLRRGADGNANSPNAANYDDSKVTPFTLPDPLLLNNGKKVKTAKVWWTKRRPQIVEDFDREIYGRVPAHTPKINWEVISTTNEKNGDFPVITEKLIGHVDNSAYPLVKVDIQLTLSTPSNASGPVPVIMEFGLSPEFLAAMRKRFTPEQMKLFEQSGPTWQQQVLAKGWGYAEYIPTSVQADNGARLTEGIIGLMNKGQPRKLDDWGALRAWAWGASRALDYFQTDKSVDAKQVGIEGHSRYGKATLVTMAYDPRFAIAYVSSSGAGGAALYRRNFGEQIGNVAGTNEYHWMAGNFLKYAGPLTPNDMPVDSHELIAMCAPRPVFISGGATKGDGWVDAHGMFLSAVAAGPVYKLLGKKDLGTTVFPPIETPLIDGDLAFRQHSGGHTPGPNWPTFITFAGRYLNAPSMKSSTAQSSVSPEQTSHEIALTFDDLPVHGPLPQGLTREDIANSVIRALESANAPPIYGFVNATWLKSNPSTAQVLQLWRDAGFPLGSHTLTHMDPNTNSLEAFEQNILADEPTLEKYMDGQDWHWLRFPYLHEGETPEKHRAIMDFLKLHNYRVAQVTLSFGDYNYNEPYARCLAKNDEQAIEQLKQSYLDGANEQLTDGPKIASLIYGRDIKHIMLLHIGGFETVMLPKLLDLLQQRGWKLITLPEATTDPAFADDPQLSTYGGTFLQQVMNARHITPPPATGGSKLSLDAVCR